MEKISEYRKLDATNYFLKGVWLQYLLIGCIIIAILFALSIDGSSVQRKELLPAPTERSKVQKYPSPSESRGEDGP